MAFGVDAAALTPSAASGPLSGDRPALAAFAPHRSAEHPSSSSAALQASSAPRADAAATKLELADAAKIETHAAATEDAASDAASGAAPGAIRSEVRYSLPSSEQLFLKVEDASKDVKEWPTNMQRVDVPVDIHDVRPLIGRTSLDREGFEIHVEDSAVASWDDEAQVTSVYHAEAVDLVKRATGAKHAVVFDHTFRRVDNSKPGRPVARDPVEGVHVDYSSASAQKRVEDFFGKAATERAGRYGIVNLWRPVVATVYDRPLGFIDATTVQPQDMSVYNLVYPDRVGQNQTVHPSSDGGVPHRWYYLPRQRGDEVYLFKQFDSDACKTQWVPHSAFKDPTAPAEGSFQPRESIELRIFVFYDASEEEISALKGAA